MNIISKIMRTVGILLLAVLFLVSCASEGHDDLPFVTLGSDEKMLITEYRLVVSPYASGELLNVAQSLCRAIGNQTGVESRLSYDSDRFSVSDGTWIVYIGNVDVTEVKDRLRGMRSEDYICRSFDRTSVIGGRNDGATVTAVNRFIEEILPVSDKYRPIPEGGGFEHLGSYDVEGLNVRGVCISEFAIFVTNPDDAISVNLAYGLRDEISEHFGYWLDVYAGTLFYEGRGIYIGSDNSCTAGRGELSFSENDIFLKAADTSGLEKLAEVFLQLLNSDGSTGVLDPTIPDHIYVPYGDTKCDIATVSLKYTPALDSVSAYSALGKATNSYTPDLVLLGEADDNNSTLLSEILYRYESEISMNGAAFFIDEISAKRLSTVMKDGLFYEVFSVKCGTLEFILLYISGEPDGEMVADVFDIIGETPLPIMAISYIKGDKILTLTHSGLSFFEESFSGEVALYRDIYSYVCYADVSRLTVTEGKIDESIGYKQVTVSVN